MNSLFKVGIQTLEIINVVCFESIEKAVGSYHTDWEVYPVEFLREHFEGLTSEHSKEVQAKRYTRMEVKRGLEAFFRLIFELI